MMSHEEIKKALHKNGLTFSALAKASGKHSSNLISCSNRSSRSRPSALVISAALGMPVTEVFSDIPAYTEAPKSLLTEESVNKAKKLLENAGLEFVA